MRAFCIYCCSLGIIDARGTPCRACRRAPRVVLLAPAIEMVLREKNDPALWPDEKREER